MAGPSLNGPTGWTAATLAPQTTNLPISDAAVSRIIGVPGSGYRGSLPVISSEQTARDDAATKKMRVERVAKLKPEAEALEAAGDQKSLEKALDIRKKIALLESTDLQGSGVLDLYKQTVNNFKTTHPDYKLTEQEQFGLNLNLSGRAGAASLAESALGPTSGGGSMANFSPTATAASSGGGNLSQYDLTPADFGGGVVNPRGVVQKQTPLESLLAAIRPDLAAGAPPDPFADPRAPSAGNSVFQNVIAGLNQPGASGAASGWTAGGPSLSGPAVGPSYGANLAATIPGAPPFLAGAINGVNTYNPYMQRPMAPQAVGGGFDPLIGLSAISAEQRVQAAQLAKDKAAAQARWFKSQADMEQQKADQANMSRLKGFSNSGWVGPSLPTY